MCLILLALQHHPDYPLIVISNRDEQYSRPTLPAHFWQDHPNIYAGRDQIAGGTWMGVSIDGRFAATTNFREPLSQQSDHKQTVLSRGHLTRSYLSQSIDHYDYLAHVEKNKQCYAGFNLLLGNHQQLFYYSNRAHGIYSLPAGVHGLSNGLLNESWPKVSSGKKALEDLLYHTADPEKLLTILFDETTAADQCLPNTGVGLEHERVLSSRFIRSSNYGTRACTVLTINKFGEVTVWEKNVTPSTTVQEINKTSFKLV